MDDILEQFGSTNITKPNETGIKSNFDNLYKNWGRLEKQEERRKDLLDFQKSKRQSNLDNYRGILDLVNAVEENEVYDTKSKPCYRPNIYVAGFHKTSPTYRDVLMLSEWLIEKPDDFETNWYVVPCPKGVRMLVVANNNITKFYTKYGKFRFVKRTALPGGNPVNPKGRPQCCVLDCFYVEQTNTAYVLDLLVWNNQPMTDGETEFRHYWLTTQFNEYPGMNVISKRNQVIFKLLPKVNCDKDSFNKFMMTFPHFENHIPSLDGLLFYHKRAGYFGGETPLVGWLFPFMVPEIIGSDVTVNQAYMLGKPSDYTDQADFIKQFALKNAKKYKNGRESMDTSSESTDSKTENEKGDGDKNNTTKLDDNMEAEENTGQTTTIEASGSGDLIAESPPKKKK